jgi:hypothetical protein
MRDDDNTKRLSGMGDRRGDLLFSAGIAGVACRTQTDDVPEVRIYLASVMRALRLPNLPGI